MVFKQYINYLDYSRGYAAPGKEKNMYTSNQDGCQ